MRGADQRHPRPGGDELHEEREGAALPPGGRVQTRRSPRVGAGNQQPHLSQDQPGQAIEHFLTLDI